ncbi:hypothetical protein FACS1894208_00870 [Clostridia bacterium]|nr:hypothetical protein FACS1894208_00870 [Clostridia bacterium]
MAAYKRIDTHYLYEASEMAALDCMFAGIFRREAFETESALEKAHGENLAKFSAHFADNIFQDEYSVLYELAAVRRLVTGGWDIMESVIDENREMILSAPQVNLKRGNANSTESDDYDAFVSLVRALYTRVCDMTFTSVTGFTSACNGFIELFEKRYMRKVLQNMSAILNSSEPWVDFRGGRRHEYLGYNGANEYYLVERTRIDALRGAQRARQFVVGTDWLHEQLDTKYQAQRKLRTERLCEIGIPEIDNAWAGLRRTHFIGVIGPPKGGKTTLSAFFVYKLLRAGKRVAVWAMEGSAQESWIDKLLIARSFEKGYELTVKDLRDGMYSAGGEKSRKLEELHAELTLGDRLSFIEETGYVEDFLDVIDGHYRAYNPFDALVIDSPINLQSRTGRKKSEYLSSAYILLKDYAEHKLAVPPVVICTAQFKQDALKEARNSVEIVFDDTSGGETAETIRTPDDVLGLFGTPEQKDAHRTTLYHIASRHSALFKPLQVRADFEHSFFSSVNAV